ncbi:hypothetical protein GGQ84_001968 [Desulfitispora alkaliphila]|uniref:DUF3793 family protein n=1 Tax=Desulfitispora alkaliphila TaxID=622674 RepID=UPI003D20F218
MDKLIKMQYLKTVSKLEGKEYITSLVAFIAAPTVKGIKPSSLVTLTKHKKNKLYLWDKYKDEICRELNLKYFELRKKQGYKTVLLFKREMLVQFLANDENVALLTTLGYHKDTTLEEKLHLLRNRYEDSCPHEIGTMSLSKFFSIAAIGALIWTVIFFLPGFYFGDYLVVYMETSVDSAY